jgi:carbon monoxide dehydrogenase subunit G
MKLDGDYVFDAGVDEVWAALFDPAVLAAVLPGCEKLELVDGAYVGDIKVKVGPIQGKFAGKVDLVDKVEPTSYRMIVDGRGAQGFVKATASIALAPEAEGRTKITYTSEAQVGGKIASVGSRLIETSARAIVKQSLEGLNENIKIRVAAHKAHAATVSDTATETGSETETESETETGSETETETETGSETETETGTGSGSGTETGSVTASPPSTPVVEYKKADASKLAGVVAKEVGKTLLPYLLLGAAVIGLVIWLLVR